MWQHLTTQHHGCTFWPDLPHKMQRKQAGAVSRCPDAQSRMRALMKVFRSSRAPFSTSRFGNSLKESRQRLVKALKQDPENEVLQMFLPGIAKHMDIPFSKMTPQKAIEALAAHSGVHVVTAECKDVRWGAWLDHAQAWDRVWHLEAMTQLFASWETGENPWSAKAPEDKAAQDERVYSIKKMRFQVSSSV